jgi:tRNA nucleotidyltransferase (CCA-adding enzyme)
VDTGAHLLLVLDQAARLQAPLPARFAALCHDLGKGTTPPEEWPRHIAHEARSERLTRELCSRLKPPSECSELALVVAREHTHIHQAATFGAAAVLRLLERCDAFRRPERFELALLACEADARGRLGLHADYPSAPLLRQARRPALDVDTALDVAPPQAGGARARRPATP